MTSTKELLVAFPENWTDNETARKDAAELVSYVSPFIESFEFGDSGLRLHLAVGDGSFDLEAIESGAQQLLTRCAEASARSQDEVLEEFDAGLPPPEDALAALLESGQVHFNMPGVPTMEGDFLALMNRLDKLFLDYARDAGAAEQSYATTVPTNSLLQNGYLKSFPQHAMLVGSIHRNFDSLNAISDNPGDYPDASSVADLVSDFEQTLSPTVCYHCFERYREAVLTDRSRLITAIGKCHRHEGRNTKGLTRLKTYTMREIIYFGDKEFVRHWQLAILDKCKDLVAALGLRFRIVAASDPFFATTATQKKDFQRFFRLKYELQTHLPFEDRWISVASFNNHQQTLADAYDISAPEPAQELHSGCFGVGYERLAFAIVAQKGVDPSRWPQSLRS